MEIQTKSNSHRLPLVALAGSPNSGKSSLFNALTGGNQKTGNFPGITVEKKVGEIKSDQGHFQVIDLPGTYSLDTRTIDEKIARDVLLGVDAHMPRPQAIIVVVDACQLSRSLYLVYELKRLNLPLVVALNLWDLAEMRGLRLDLKKLQEGLGVPVVPTIATQSVGTSHLVQSVQKILDEAPAPKPTGSDFLREIKKMDFIHNAFQDLETVLNRSVLTPISPDSFSEKIDHWILHPVMGPLLLVVVLFFMFQALFSWAEPLISPIEASVSWLQTTLAPHLPDNDLKGLLIDGMIGGVGGIIVFLPQILILFALILFLEDIGYLGRAAFLLDHLMRRLGLPGKAVVPLLSSHACAIPGIMSTRTLSEEKDRLATMLVSPLTTCSARLPVYALLIGAIIPASANVGPFSAQGIFLFGLYLIGIMSAFIMAAIFKKTFFAGSISRLLMELPPYRLPNAKQLLMGLWQRAMIFLKRAGTIILSLSVLIWFLVTYPKPPIDATEPPINYSAAATIGKNLGVVFSPLGFDWRISTSLIPSMGAREVVVASLGTVFAVEEGLEEDALNQTLSSIISSHYSIATLLSLMVWFIFAPQCISTVAIFRRESGGWKWPSIMLAYTFFLAYFFSFLTYQVASRLIS